MSNLVARWKKAAEDLRFEIIAPYTVVLQSGVTLRAELLVKNFGAKKGMLVYLRYDELRAVRDEIVKMGFGFSVMGEMSTEEYVREVYIEVLADWGWSGEEQNRPAWLDDVEE